MNVFVYLYISIYFYMVHSQPQRALLRLGVDNNVICDCRMCSVCLH